MTEGNLEMAWGQFGKTAQVDPYMSVVVGPMLLTTAGAINALDNFETYGMLAKRFNDIQEAIIGTTFVLAAAGSMLLMSQHPQGTEHISNILTGQIIWVDYQQITWLLALYAIVLLLWYSLLQTSQRLLFYILFAITVTASVQIAGVLLVFASLIFPALAVRHLSGHKATLYGFAIGAVGYLSGFVVPMVSLLAPCSFNPRSVRRD